MGLDLACEATGVALPTGRTETWRPPRPPGKRTVDYRGLRAHWYQGQMARALRLWAPDLVVIEEVAGHGQPHTVAAIAYVRSAVEVAIYESEARLVEVNPSTLKKWATGSGRADKADMIAAAEARGGRPANDDEADAYLLRAWGLELVGEG